MQINVRAVMIVLLVVALALVPGAGILPPPPFELKLKAKSALQPNPRSGKKRQNAGWGRVAYNRRL